MKDWTVEMIFEGTVSVSERDVDRTNWAHLHRESMPVTLRCQTPSKPGIVFDVEGDMTATRWFGDGRTWRTPWTFSRFRRLVVTGGDEAPPSTVFKEVGLGSAYKAVGDHFRDLAAGAREHWGESTAMPNTGPRGYPPGHYAVWARRIDEARKLHGRGYMAQLLAAYPGETRSNILRSLERAEQLGLYVSTNEPGKLGAGHMTDKGLALLKEAGQQ